MNDDEKNVLNGVFANLGSLLVAFAFLFASRPIVGFFFGEVGPITKNIGMVIFFGIVIADPVSAFFEIRAGEKTIKSYVYRVMITLLVAGVAIPIILAISALASDIESKPISMIISIVPAFLIMPLMFMMPLLQKRMGRKGEQEEKLGEDFQIAMIFPVYSTLAVSLTLGTTGALALANAPLAMGLVLAFSATLVAVTETWAAEDDDLFDLEGNQNWGERAKSAEEAWNGLRAAIGSGTTSAVFMGSSIYIGLASVSFEDSPMLSEQSVGQLLAVILVPMLTMLGVILAMIFFAVIVISAAVWSMARLKGADPLSMTELATQAFVRLLLGGMNHVRPDLEDD